MAGIQSGAHVNAVFENLLPDNADLRRRIAERTEARSARPHDLLAAIGRDCIGAMQFLSHGADPGDPFLIEGTPEAKRRLRRRSAIWRHRRSVSGLTPPSAFPWPGHRKRLPSSGRTAYGWSLRA